MKYAAPLVAVLLLQLSACSSYVQTTISTFRDDTIAATLGSIKVVPKDPSLTSSLEFRFYSEKLEARLAQMGYQVQDGPTDYLASLDYRVQRREAENRGSAYILGELGGGYYSHHRGTLVLTDRSGTAFEFERTLAIDIRKSPSSVGDSVQKLLELKAVSVGHCALLFEVYDEMLSAIFSNLMRPNGSVVRVKTDANTPCK